MNELTLFEKQIPIRGIPKNELETFLNTKFKFWLAKLLSLKENKEDAYDADKNAIKTQ